MTETTPQIKSIVGGISSVVYQSNGDSYRFNLTKMAKPFGKKVSHWRSLKETQEYLNALQVSVSDDKKNGIIDSLIVTLHVGGVVHDLVVRQVGEPLVK